MTAALPYAFAKRHGVVVTPDGKTCLFTGAPPMAVLAEVQRSVGFLLAMREVTRDVLNTTLEEIYRDSASAAAGAAAKAGEGDNLAALADSAAAVDDLLDQRDDAPVVRLINALFLEAIRERASDIHIEVEEKRLVVRFRVDGVMRDVLEPNRALAAQLTSRIKVMGKLDIAEKRLPQDGRVSLKVAEYELDVRISTLPAQYGERVVLRLLDRGQTRAGVGELGMSGTAAEAFQRILNRPDGIILVTGPTGSGKTTTLYAAIDALNDRARNIMTIEDPIEYALPGIGQMQVNPGTGLDFARGLRAILRQDPDVIMVGEIRDGETARIAVESAMTGHLVLSTLHTNTAIGAVARMIDLGVERFLLAPMVRGLLAQRLVRRICDGCRAPHMLTQAQALSLGAPPDDTVFHGAGCNRCSGTGYHGRVALYEVIEGSGALEQAISSAASEADITALIRQQADGLVADGRAKIRTGMTTPQEVIRVAFDTGPDAGRGG